MKFKDINIENVIRAIKKNDNTIRYFVINSINKLNFFVLDLKNYELFAFKINEDMLEQEIGGTELQITPIGFNCTEEDKYIIYEQKV